MRRVCLLAFWTAMLFVFAEESKAGAIVNGFDASSLAANDDGSTGAINLDFTANFFGSNFSQVFVNNNGNLTFTSALAAFSAFEMRTTRRSIIAPFFADIDTRSGGGTVTYGSGTFDGKKAFGVNWLNVGYFRNTQPRTNTNSFQALLVDRSDIGLGDFDIIFNYDRIVWESGSANGGNAAGLGGLSARIGFSNGTRQVGSFFELPGSAATGRLVDGSSTALVSNRLNSDVNGRYIFEVRNGSVGSPVVPEPASMAMFSIGMIAMILRRGDRVAERSLRLISFRVS